ncbi:GreA/GreB family elongation factor [Winogradskyella aurantia]|uniref:3-oxoacyl-ACP synthase n=1 Tax=Winogradskyella aurantia TaxID=1915063 RepID=A0A265V002_9FLAO|nr:3-oxoacyl-ACP synthase [Winogradskyella aurantia]OZV70890.1 3-oxoacyl-ACP synthase [Winogradskyella aurantia]
MVLKQQLYQKCRDFLNERLETIQCTILDIQNSLLSETKSSAGDKHETGRAMLQLEREKAGYQLAEVQKLKELLDRIDPTTINENIALGSIVFTSKFNYFIALSAGEIEINGDVFYAISPSTPIAVLLLSKSMGDTITFRDTNFIITKIL